jgi:hypothetical protein
MYTPVRKVKENKKFNVHCVKYSEAIRNKISAIYAKCIKEQSSVVENGRAGLF